MKELEYQLEGSLFDVLGQIPWALIAPILGLQLLLIIVALVDLKRIPTTNGPKWLWVVIILFVNIIGPIVYFVIGRKQS